MWVNPYEGLEGQRWKKVNFHTHAGTGLGTCGSNPIDAVVEVYKQYQYDALCISNHDLYTDTSAFTDDQITMMPGVEYSNDGHMLTIGVDRSLHEFGHQQTVDQVRAMGGFTILCHPHWIRPDYWPFRAMMDLRGYIGIEVINMLIYRLTGTGLATDVWDELLSAGRLTYGFANDDFHLLGDVSRSYTLICADGSDLASLRPALDTGKLCASTGLYPVSLSLAGGVLRAEACLPSSPGHELLYRFIADGGRILKEQKGRAASCDVGDATYVRAEAHADSGAMLLFQPVYNSRALAKE